MSVTISGTNGIDKVQDGTIQSADFAAGVPARSNLPAGTVLQVVQGTYSTQVSTTSATYQDTGLTASITPTSASSKVLIVINNPMCGYRLGEDARANARVLRDATVLTTYGQQPIYAYSRAGAETQIDAFFSYCYLDSPSSTSSLVYKMQFSSDGSSTAFAQNSSMTATITLMEIAA